MASPEVDDRSIEHQAIANALFGKRLVTRSGDVAGSDLYPAAEHAADPDRVLQKQEKQKGERKTRRIGKKTKKKAKRREKKNKKEKTEN